MRKRLGWASLMGVFALLAVALPGASAPEDGTVRFSAVGDISSSTAARTMLAGIGAADHDMTIALGDLSYGATGAEQAWCDLVTERVGAGYPFELVAGNHESNGQNGNINDFSACLPNQLPGVVGTYGRQYYVDVPQADPLVRHVMISPGIPYPDSTWSYAAGTPRYAWTAAAIDGARAAGIPWVVVSTHMPCLSVGVHGCASGADVMNLLVSKKVDLVLNGHEHNYARTKQLALGGTCAAVPSTTYDAACVADSDASLRKGAGTVIATVGTGGVELRDVATTSPVAPYFAALSGANQTPAFGYLDVSVAAEELQATFVPTSGGTFTDAFTIAAGVEPPNTPPTAAFTSTVQNLSATMTSTSTDSDGVVTSHAWDYGDGTTGTGSPTTHAYAQAGTYDVTLTVTDDDGATASLTRQVTVTTPPTGPVPFATDAFARTVTGGWGVAEKGGTWTRSGSATSHYGGRAGQDQDGVGRVRPGRAAQRRVVDRHRGPRRGDHRQGGHRRRHLPHRRAPGGGHQPLLRRRPARLRRRRVGDAGPQHRHRDEPADTHRHRPDLHPGHRAAAQGAGDGHLADHAPRQGVARGHRRAVGLDRVGDRHGRGPAGRRRHRAPHLPVGLGHQRARRGVLRQPVGRPHRLRHRPAGSRPRTMKAVGSRWGSGHAPGGGSDRELPSWCSSGSPQARLASLRGE